jgi:LDH2 family malate/lactate/ureidoglycolate dehydrogenase
MQTRMKQGIEIDDQTWADIVHAAKQFDVPINK